MKVNQENIIAENVAGRDLTIEKHYHGDVNLYFLKLYEEYKKEILKDDQIIKKIEELEIFTQNIDSVFLGLREKLLRGKREDEIDGALRAKEQFSKLLLRHQFHASAQKVYAYLLAQIQITFETYVKPEILANKPRAEVDKVMFEKIIHPIEAKLGSNELDINAGILKGMIFYLTGNCHIKWD